MVYRWNKNDRKIKGEDWNELVDLLTLYQSIKIKSDPPTGKKKIINIWWDPDTSELVFDHEA